MKSDGTDILLVTERMVLRRFHNDDVDLIVELDSDPEVMRFVTGGVATSRAEVVDDFLPAWLAYYDRYDGYGFFAAEDRATGEFLGWFHLRPPPDAPDDEPELGYRFRRACWGKGLATEGSRALVALAFERLHARRVNAETMVVNVASQRVMEKAGLHRIRVFHQDWPYPIEGSEHGDVEYAVTREQWDAAASSRG